MSALEPPVAGLIAHGDIVAVTGDLAFAKGLAAVLGEGVGFLRNADLDRRADFHATVDAGQLVLTQPWKPRAAPNVAEAEAPPEHRAYIIFLSETARQRESTCTLAPVVLEALSPAFARVLKAGGQPITNTGLRLIGGQAVVSRLTPTPAA